MKKGLFTFLLLVCSSQLFFAQKVTVKNDIVSVDGTAVFTLVYKNYPEAITLYNLNNEKLAIFSAEGYSDSKLITNSNPNGKVNYFDITFLNPDMDKCEIPIFGLKKHLAQYIISEGLVKEGKLDEAAVKQFCRINGTKFSEDRKNAGTTVIIKN
jgi:hypothetical protein